MEEHDHPNAMFCDTGIINSSGFVFVVGSLLKGMVGSMIHVVY